MLFIHYLAIFTSVATATSFQAWSGGQCNGAQGSKVTIAGGGSCEAMGGRGSWQASGDNVKGYYYSGSGCSGTRTQFYANNNACNNINTGYAVESLCIVGKSCLLIPIVMGLLGLVKC